MSTERKVTSNIVWLLIERAVRLVIGFVVSLWVARGLGPELFGVFGYAQATVSILGFLGLYAIEAIVIKELVDTPSARDEILGSAAALRLIGGGTCIGAVVLATHLLAVTQPSVRLVSPILAAAVVFQGFDVIEYWLRLKLLSKIGVVAKCLALLIGGLLRVLAVQSAAPLYALALAVLAESILIAGGLVLAARRGGISILRWSPRWSRMRMILRQSFPIVLSAIAVAIYVRIGVIILGNLSGHFQVGLLAVATLVAETLHAFAVAVAASYGPIILGRRTLSKKDFDNEVLRLMRYFFIGSLALAAVVTIASEPIMQAFFGSGYAGSGRVLSVLVWSIVFVYISVASELWFVGHGLQRFLFAKTLSSAVIFVVLCFALIPSFGAIGVACATLVCYSFSAFFSNLLFVETRPLFKHQLRALAVLQGIGKATT